MNVDDGQEVPWVEIQREPGAFDGNCSQENKYKNTVFKSSLQECNLPYVEWNLEKKMKTAQCASLLLGLYLFLTGRCLNDATLYS